MLQRWDSWCFSQLLIALPLLLWKSMSDSSMCGWSTPMLEPNIVTCSDVCSESWLVKHWHLTDLNSDLQIHEPIRVAKIQRSIGSLDTDYWLCVISHISILFSHKHRYVFGQGGTYLVRDSSFCAGLGLTCASTLWPNKTLHIPIQISLMRDNSHIS